MTDEMTKQDNQKKDRGTTQSLWQRVKAAGKWLDEGHTTWCENHPEIAFFSGLGAFIGGNVAIGALSLVTGGLGVSTATAAFNAAVLSGMITYPALKTMDKPMGVESARYALGATCLFMVTQAWIGAAANENDKREAQRLAEFETLPEAQEIMSAEQYEAFKAGYCENSRGLMNPEEHKITFNGQDAIIDCTP